MQSAFLSWRSAIGGHPFPGQISASGDRSPGPGVKTDSGTMPPRQLQAGSNLNKTAEGPWLNVLDAGLVIDFNDGAAWPRNNFKEIYHQNINGNYGSVSSLANFGYRGTAFPGNHPGTTATIGLLPITPSASRPMWNNLPSAQYNLRVVNPNNVPMTNQANIENQNAYSLSFNQAGVASLNPTGQTMGQVLL